MKRHKHAYLIIAWANGAEIEAKGSFDSWFDYNQPSWHPDIEYRIKPAEKKLTPCWLWASKDGAIAVNLYSEYEMIDSSLNDDYPIKLLWSETLLDLGDEE